MQTIHAGNMKKSAFIRSQLEACKIGQKFKKNFLKKPFSTSIFEVLSNLYRLSLSQMAGCKRCLLKGGRREREKEEERKGKGRKKWGSKSFFIYLLLFLSPCACFFICAVVIFQIYKENCI